MTSKHPVVSVTAFWKESKGRYFLKWKDCRTGDTKTKQTDIVVRNQKGERAAGKLASDYGKTLNDALAKPEDGTTWEQFQAMYKELRLPYTSKDNQTKWRCSARIFDAVWPAHVHGILMLAEITPMLLLRTDEEFKKRLSEGSVGSYSATLRAGFSWAAKMGLMPMLPARPQETETENLPAMRLVPIALESLEKMEFAAAKVAGKQHAKGIADYLRCLWLCGGRLVDPVWMHPFRLDCHHPIVLDGERPLFGWVSRQKNKRDQIARVTIDFARWIKPRCDTDGWLFNPTCEHGRIETKHPLSTLIAEIGKVAGVIAEPSLKKTATAKHFRSSFVTRWSRRGMPIELISSMARHANIETTRKYYLAPPDADLLRTFSESDSFGDQFGDLSPLKNSKTS